jgi:hypothetical protein
VKVFFRNTGEELLVSYYAAPSRHLTWVFALMEQRSRREAGARG